MSSHALPPHLDPHGRHRGRGAGFAVARPIVRVLLAMLSVGCLVLAGYYWLTFRNIDKGLNRLPGLTVNANPSNSTKDIDGKDQNILLVGNDDRTNMTDAEVKELHVGRDGGSKATDTMMIVHVPANGSKATLISLPRDSYVAIPGHGMDKLNSAYVFGYNQTNGSDEAKRTAGANLLISTITNLTGLTINHYVQIDLLGFYRISKAIGGVPVNLCKAVNDTVKHNRAIGSDGGSGLVLSAGKHTLSGVQALEFVRQRHGLNGGDLDRVRRQQYFLTAAFRQVASVGILFKLNAVGNALKRSLYFDPNLNIIDLAHQLENLTANNIVGKTIPTSPQTLNDGTSILAVNPSQVQTFVSKLIATTNGAPSSAAPKSGGGGSSKTKSPAPTSGAPSPSKTKALDSKCIN